MSIRYPMRAADAVDRRWDLEREIRRVDRLLARKPSPALEAVRARLEVEFDALYDAVECLSALPGLPICPCGKLAHPDQPSAVRHARMLGLINDRPDPDRAPLATYRCVDSGTWHVGHDRRGT